MKGLYTTIIGDSSRIGTPISHRTVTCPRLYSVGNETLSCLGYRACGSPSPVCVLTRIFTLKRAVAG